MSDRYEWFVRGPFANWYGKPYFRWELYGPFGSMSGPVVLDGGCESGRAPSKVEAEQAAIRAAARRTANADRTDVVSRGRFP